jgi:hypothetical protein
MGPMKWWTMYILQDKRVLFSLHMSLCISGMVPISILSIKWFLIHGDNRGDVVLHCNWSCPCALLIKHHAMKMYRACALLIKHHAMKMYGGGAWRYSSTIFDLGTRWKWQVSSTSRPLYPLGDSPQYPLDRKLGGPQNHTL